MGSTLALGPRGVCRQQRCQFIESGLGFMDRGAVQAFGEAGVVGGEAVVGFTDLAGLWGDAGELGADAEIATVRLEVVGMASGLQEEVLHLRERSALAEAR